MILESDVIDMALLNYCLELKFPQPSHFKNLIVQFSGFTKMYAKLSKKDPT